MPKYDYDLIVIGGGAAGLTASTGAGSLGAKTLLIEKEKELGGDCLHYGCVPSKSLIKSAYAYRVLKQSQKYGLPKIDVPPVDFKKVRDRIRGIIGSIQVHDSPEHLKDKYNVETKFGHAQFTDQHTINLDGQKLTSRNFIITTGSSPVIPPIEGLNDVPFITNMDIFSLDQLPSSMIVLGGGPIGSEMAQAFARLGTKVTVVQSNAQLLPKEDSDISRYVRAKFESEGIDIHLKTRAVRAASSNGLMKITVESNGRQQELSAEKVLVSTGRKPNVDGLDLEKAGVEFGRQGIKVDQNMRTTAKNIYACGDCSGGFLFTHVAGYEGGIAMANAVMRLPAKADYTKVPWVTYLDPEIASVGYNEQRAKEAGIAYTFQKDDLAHNDRAKAEGETEGFIKILIDKKGNPIGVQIIGFHAGDLIHEWVAVLNGKVSLATIAQSIHAYPTLSEISKTSSGNYYFTQSLDSTPGKIIKFLMKHVYKLQGNI